MSIAHIVTRGIGPDAAIKGIITAGFLDDGGAPDVTGPVPLSFTIDPAGDVALGLWDEAANVGVGGSTGFTLTPTNGGAAVTITYTGGNGTAMWDFDLSRPVSSTETFTWSYTNPGNGAEDPTGNDAANFTGEAVTNDSEVNTAPSDISTTGSTISEAAANGAVLCVLTAVDVDPGETFTWALVVGAGDTNNADVALDANTGVVTVDSASTLGIGSYTYRAQVTDSATNTRAEAFAFSVVAASTRAIVMNPVQSPIGTIVVDPVVL